MGLTEVDLKESRDGRSFGEVADRRTKAALAALALYCKLRLSIAQNDEIDFSLVCVAQKAQLHRVAFRVFDPVAVLEELARDEVLETRPPSGAIDQSQRYSLRSFLTARTRGAP